MKQKNNDHVQFYKLIGQISPWRGEIEQDQLYGSIFHLNMTWLSRISDQKSKRPMLQIQHLRCNPVDRSPSMPHGFRRFYAEP